MTNDQIPKLIPDSERRLRRLLALYASGPGLYTDDGELSCCAEAPDIDFLRDTPELLEQKLQARGQKRYDRLVFEDKRIGPGLPKCVEACLATMLAVPMWRVGDLSVGAKHEHSEHSLRTILWNRADEFMKLQGLHLHTAFSPNYTFPGFSLAVGSTETRSFHAVVLLAGELFHDPLVDGTGLKQVEAIKLLVPLNPIQRLYSPAVLA